VFRVQVKARVQENESSDIEFSVQEKTCIQEPKAE
jgi:hypothetical protein